jgi:hypothetical protein
MTFTTEKDLVKIFLLNLAGLTKSKAEQKHAIEFDYRRGRTDVILLSEKGELISVEAKLTDWRTALHQAYRNTCFSDKSYVLIPESISKKVSEFKGEFTRRGVGLCSICENGNVKILKRAPKAKPLQTNLRDKAIKQIMEHSQ